MLCECQSKPWLFVAEVDLPMAEAELKPSCAAP
jgi:hypothetical protein